MSTIQPVTESILADAARLLPVPQLLHSIGDDATTFMAIAVPKGMTLEQIDLTKHLPAPQRIQAAAVVHDMPSLVEYLKRHAQEGSAVWVKLDPVTYALTFKAQIDEHMHNAPSWRQHTCTYTPRLSVEWERWKQANAEPMEQARFATFIEDNLADIASKEGRPAGTDMLQMALQFEAKQDMRLKSHIRLQSGAVKLEYVAADDDATIQRMEMFDRFALGIPVFAGGERWAIEARLKYRAREGKAVFWFELIRPDLVHEAAARAEVQRLREQLTGADEWPFPVPLLMGVL